MVKTAQMQLSTRPAIPLFDRASAFLASVLIFSITCSLIFMQNLVAVSHIVSAHVGPPFFFGGGRGRCGIRALLRISARKKLTPHAPPFKVTHWNLHGSIGTYDFVLLELHSRPNYGTVS